jgi:hypothetical protein
MAKVPASTVMGQMGTGMDRWRPSWIPCPVIFSILNSGVISTEGEIFRVIKHGSVGTSMVGFDGQLTDDEIWSLIQYVHSFAGEHGPGMKHDRSRGVMGGCEGEGCPQSNTN